MIFFHEYVCSSAAPIPQRQLHRSNARAQHLDTAESNSWGLRRSASMSEIRPKSHLSADRSTAQRDDPHRIAFAVSEMLRALHLGPMELRCGIGAAGRAHIFRERKIMNIRANSGRNMRPYSKSTFIPTRATSSRMPGATRQARLQDWFVCDIDAHHVETCLERDRHHSRIPSPGQRDCAFSGAVGAPPYGLNGDLGLLSVGRGRIPHQDGHGKSSRKPMSIAT